jgi:tetratricopeptide (TPR) repeat protein
MKKLFVFIALILLGKLASAQDSLTLDDVKIIKARAEFVITKLYLGLVNTISSTAADNSDIKDMINRAIGEGDNKIFLTKLVAIGDDVSSPNFRNQASSHDVSIEQYLNDINTLYEKSDDHSIIFSDVKTSNVKKGKKNMFIKVYFTSIFKNKNKASLDTPYVLTAREAEVYLKKTENNKWVTYISRISFLNPADTVNDFSDDIALIRMDKPGGSASLDSVSKIQIQQNFEKELQQNELKKENDKYDAETKAFNAKMEAGDKAFANHEFALAMDAYTEAKNMRPYDIAPRAKLDKLLKTRDDLKLDDESRYRQYIEGAALEVKMRNYQSAISLYNKALVLKPQESGNLDPKIRDLNARVRILMDLNEKYRLGYYKDVIKEYSDHIKKDKTNSDFYLGRAKCYDKIGELTKSHNEQIKSYAEAMKDYTKSYDLDNNNLETIRRRGDLYKRMGKNLEALREYRTYLLVNKEDVSIYVEMSKLHLAINGNIDDAIGDLNEALNVVDQRNASLYYERGLLYAQKKDYSNADQNFSNSIKLDSNIALVYYNRGVSRIYLKDIENASIDFVTARRKGLDSASIVEINNIAETFFDRGLAKFRAGDRDSAMSLFNSAISIRPNQSNYWFNKGECYYAGGSYQDAFNAYSQAITLSPDYADAYQKRGLSNLHLNKSKEAINDFTKSLQLNPNLYESQKGLGDAYFAQKDYKNSIPAYEACFEMKSFKSGDQAALSAEIYNSIGKANFSLNDFDKALDNFKSAVKKNDGFAEAHYNRGLTYFKLNDSKNAIKEIKYAITLQGNHYEWNYDLARALEASKTYEEAEYYFANAIKMDSTHELKDAVYQHGYCNYKLRNYSAAMPDYQKSLPSLPDNTLAAAYNEMGNIYLNLGKYDSAYDYLNRSFLKDSTNGAVLYSIASCYYLKGNTDESLIWFEKSFQTKMLEKSAVENDVLLAALKDDKRYKDLKKKYHY